MRHKHLCTAAILSAALLGHASPGHAGTTGARLGHADSSPVLILHMRSYRWRLPEFRMAGNDAYVIVQVENTNDYPMEMSVSCRTADGRIPEMSGYYRIPAGEFLRMDTRRRDRPMQNGDGVKVKCSFRADSSAKVEAWKYDKAARMNGQNGAN